MRDRKLVIAERLVPRAKRLLRHSKVRTSLFMLARCNKSCGESHHRYQHRRFVLPTVGQTLRLSKVDCIPNGIDLSKCDTPRTYNQSPGSFHLVTV